MRDSFQQHFIGIALTMGLLTSASFAQDSTRVFQTVEPLTSVNKRWTDQEKVPISTTRALKPGQLIDIPLYPVGEISIQKLTSNSYWIQNSCTS